MEDKKQQFERLYEEYVDDIFRYFSWRLSNRERAKELTHDVFIRLWQYIVEENAITHEKAFIYTIAKRLFINEIRVPREKLSLESLQEKSAFDVPDTAIDAVTAATVSNIWDAVATFPFITQEIMRLRYRDGLSVKEIAETLDLGETAVSMRISRTIDALQKHFRIAEMP
jgi:RNA polymerase sigma-70 factor (ECF subfamily)